MIPADVYRVTFGGSLYGGEIWECGFWVHGGLPEDQPTANATAELWAGQLLSSDPSGALAVCLNLWWTADIKCTYVKVYAYPTGGPHATLIGEHDVTGASGTGTRVYPNQCSIVISERTGFSGRRYRGRMYLPVGKTSDGTQGQLGGDEVLQAATAWALCFHDWNAVPANGMPVVVSTSGSLFTPISQIIVDSKIDIQRRRANKEVANATGVGTV